VWPPEETGKAQKKIKLIIFTGSRDRRHSIRATWKRYWGSQEAEDRSEGKA
jgi:hypothetical protein